MKFLLKPLIACLIILGNSVSAFPQKSQPSIIFDSDIGPDYDDVGAITLLHALADHGDCKILATIASNRYNRVAAVLDVMNTYFQRPDMPIGVVGEHGIDMGVGQKWDSVIVGKYPHDIMKNEDAADAVKLYRKILNDQPDQSVTIVTVGFLTNMANLWNSAPDDFSKLSGKELVQRKVKQLVCMAGAFPSGSEYNVRIDARSSKIVFDNWTTPIIFSGVEIGNNIFTGLRLIKSPVSSSPVKDVYAISMAMSDEDKAGRKSWDQTAVLIAVRGYQKYFNVVPGKIICKDDGSNSWNEKGKGHYYVTQKMPVSEITSVIEDLMEHLPARKK